MRRVHVFQSRRTSAAPVTRLSCVLSVVLTVLGAISPAEAAITASGDVSPGNLATWNDIVTGYVGYTGAGTLAVNDLTTVLANCQTSGASAGGDQAVTEPGALALLAAGAIGLLVCAGRRRK